MLDILLRWNRWGKAKLAAGISREVTLKLEPFLFSPEVVALIGPRRAGKTTVLFQVMDTLERAGIPQEAMLHVNFEEPALSPELGLELLDNIYKTYRNEIYPEGRAYLFFDEIQNISQWERWIRARNESENMKFFITGSSSQLMSRELGTLLTGRHVSFKVMPLSFKEFLHFKSISLPKKSAHLASIPSIQHALNIYLKWGGFPEIVLAENEQRKELLLKQYFDDILFKDVAMRHRVRDIFALRNLAVYLLTHSGSLVSFQRLAKIFEVSVDLAQAYCQYLQEAFLVDFIPFYSNKAAERNRNPQKVYAIDLGLRHVVNLAHSADKGHLQEAAVYHALMHQAHDGIFYWKGDGEIDFLLRQGTAIRSLIQVVSANLENPQVQKREANALLEAGKVFKQAEKYIVIGEDSGNITKLSEIEIVALINLLANEVSLLWRN